MNVPTDNNQPLTIVYDNLIIGSSLEAVLFAHETQTPLISCRLERPYYFEEIQDFGLGSNKLEIWQKYAFILSLANLMPMSDKIKHIRYVDANTLKVILKADKTILVKYNRLFVFDDYRFYDLPNETGITTNENMVIDWFHVISGRHHDFSAINRDNPFINKILFYERPYGKLATPPKNALVLSYLSKHQLDNPKYADYVVKIKTEKLMAESGIKQKGASKPAIEHLRRDIIKLGRNIYDNFDNVTFMYADPKSTWEFGNKRSKINYLRYINMKLKL